MFRNYLNTAIRNLWKSKLYSFINIGGLALGISVAVLILLYVDNELSYDQWLPSKDRLHRVYRQWDDGGSTGWTPDPLAEQMVSDFPEVAQAAGLSSVGETMVEYRNNKIYIEDVARVDSTFFDILALPFQYGRRLDALTDPNSVVLSKRVTELFFGPSNPIGEIIRLNDSRDLMVTGVIETLGNTHLSYEIFFRYTRSRNTWNSNNRTTYVKLNEQINVPELEAKLTEQVNQFKIAEWEAIGVKPGANELPGWRLQPVSDIHLHSSSISYRGSGGDIKYVYIFALIAFIVLLIGGINYVNLSTARAANRAKEVGVRKATGARRGQLVAQFLVETVVQAMIALVIGVFFVELFLPGFNQIVDRELVFFSGNWISWIAPLLVMTTIIGLLAGAYPALVMSAYQPVKVLKGLVRGRGGEVFRRGLVVTQFSMSVALIIVMLFIYQQINFMMNEDLGFAGEQVLVIPMNTDETQHKMKRMRSTFLSIPGVEEVTTASRMPGHGYPDWSLEVEGRTEMVYPRVLFTEEQYDDVLGLDLLEGRFFSSEHPSDTLQAYVVNEAFVKQYHIDNPLEAKLKFTGDEEYGHIIGVVKDYHYRGLDQEIQPLLMMMGDNRYYTGLLLSSNDLAGTIAAVERLWREVEPSHPMRYSFLNEDFAGLYEEHSRFGQALFYATALAILVAILGLFGLATYTAVARTREIGVRKVLGASVQQLSMMLVKDFVRWVLLSGLIAIPMGYLIANRWLEDFAYRIELSALPFIVAICFAIVIATLTVGTQAVRAATRNPVEALRSE